MKRITQLLAISALTLLVSGCYTPLHRGLNTAANLGISNPESMKDEHFAMKVNDDEESFENYSRKAKLAIYALGLDRYSKESTLRVVHLIQLNPERVLYKSAGSIPLSTVAMVPDHLPRLRKGDVVEVRQTGTFNVINNFLEKGEGNVVTRVICGIHNPRFSECMAKAPRLSHKPGWGPTGTPYPQSPSSYGFSFTPFYDMKGNQIRPYPN